MPTLHIEFYDTVVWTRRSPAQAVCSKLPEETLDITGLSQTQQNEAAGQASACIIRSKIGTEAWRSTLIAMGLTPGHGNVIVKPDLGPQVLEIVIKAEVVDG